jgi:flagellar hook protein FlgE
MAIQGDGYFVMSDGKQNLFTRDGTFDLGIDGTLVNPSSGLHVQGWVPDPTTGLIDTTQPPTNINIPIGAGMTGKASSSLAVTGNLDSTAAAATVVPLNTVVYDSQGNAIPVTLKFTKSATADSWSMAVALPTPPPTGVSVTGSGTVTFNGNGKVLTGGTQTMTLTLTNGAVPTQTVTIDLSQLTQLSSTPSSLSANTDGASAGTLTTFTVGQAGDITGVYSNGYKQPLGQIALASFANPGGLVKAGGNLFQTSPNSGTPSIGTPNTAGRGGIATGFLEGSNVDLAQQFTNMIMAERGFQANSRVITTSDEILQDLVNIKH